MRAWKNFNQRFQEKFQSGKVVDKEDWTSDHEKFEVINKYLQMDEEKGKLSTKT